VAGEARPTGLNTPEAIDLQRLLREMADGGDGVCVLEATSPGGAQGRLEGTRFAVLIFTNLTQDHLDFHGTMERYAEAKARLFFDLLPAGGKPGATAVLNADDPVGADWARRLTGRVLTFGLRATAGLSVVPRAYRSALSGIHLEAQTPAGPVTVASRLIGEHNVMNLLGAIATGVALGLDADRIGLALGSVAAVPGRFERIDAGQEFLVAVDYAHTPDALRRVLETARPLTPGRLGVVFGAGGDRDRRKRPLMGRIAANLADRVWVTSDNPRSEDPEAIIDEIVAGMAPPPRDGYTRDPDRRAAIRDALGWARGGDTVVVAGKGHEPYQIVGGQSLPFDDREVAREILGGGPGPVAGRRP